METPSAKPSEATPSNPHKTKKVGDNSKQCFPSKTKHTNQSSSACCALHNSVLQRQERIKIAIVILLYLSLDDLKKRETVAVSSEVFCKFVYVEKATNSSYCSCIWQGINLKIDIVEDDLSIYCPRRSKVCISPCHKGVLLKRRYVW